MFGAESLQIAAQSYMARNSIFQLANRPPNSSRLTASGLVAPCPLTETGSYIRLIDSCIPQLKAQGPSRTCNESKEEGEEVTPTPLSLHSKSMPSSPSLGFTDHSQVDMLVTNP